MRTNDLDVVSEVKAVFKKRNFVFDQNKYTTKTSEVSSHQFHSSQKFQNSVCFAPKESMDFATTVYFVDSVR